MTERTLQETGFLQSVAASVLEGCRLGLIQSAVSGFGHSTLDELKHDGDMSFG